MPVQPFRTAHREPQPPPAGGETFLRRALVAIAAPGATPADLEDTAELALSLGHRGIARNLWETSFVVGGLSPARRHRQRGIAAHTGLWDDARWIDEEPMPVDRRPAMTLAVEEARALAGLPLPPRSTPALAEPATLPAAIEPPPAAWRRHDGIADLPGRLFEGLGNGDIELIDTILAEFHPLIVAPPPRVVDIDLTAGLDDLAEMVAAIRLQRFFRDRYPLCWAGSGSALLLAATARLSDSGLGPYLGNVGRVARTSRDIFGLARIAAPGDADIERWLPMLAADLDRHALVQLADDAGDHGMMSALAVLLVTEQLRRDGNGELIRAIRDAALDHTDLALAVAAQTELTRRRIDDPIEWLVLGEIVATSGDAGLAAQAFRYGQSLAPSNTLLAERLVALNDGAFHAYETRHGFASPAWRIAVRRRHRTGVAAE